MSNGIYTALSGAVAQSSALDVTANNVANASTTGFRAERMRFGEALARARGKQKDLAFVQVTGTRPDATQGTLIRTENPLDLALSGDGYFGVTTPQGARWTRAGSFRADAAGQLVTAEGYPVRSLSGRPIVIPKGAGDVQVGPDGAVSAGGAALGTIELQLWKPEQLTRQGSHLFQASGAPAAGKRAEVVSGTLEAANFDVVRGVVDLVRISRTYDAVHRMIESFREIDDRTARGIGNR